MEQKGLVRCPERERNSVQKFMSGGGSAEGNENGKIPSTINHHGQSLILTKNAFVISRKRGI